MAIRKKPQRRHATRYTEEGRWIFVKWITNRHTGQRVYPPPGQTAWRIWIPADKDRAKGAQRS